MTQRKLTVILASLVLLISLISIGRRYWPAGPRINREPFIGLGQRLAEETLKAVPGQGRIVVLIKEPSQLPGNPLHDELEAFQDVLKKHGSLSVATEVVPEELNEMIFGNNCSSAQLRTILVNHADADALVFFIGLPEWEKLQARGMAPPMSHTKIIVATDSVPTKREYNGYFANGFLSVLIGKRYAPEPSAQPKTAREWFAQSYQIYTPDNYESLPP